MFFVVHITATCTFEESHICGYTQDTSDRFNWDRASGATITQNTGPAADHTLGSSAGVFMHWLQPFLFLCSNFHLSGIICNMAKKFTSVTTMFIFGFCFKCVDFFFYGWLP